MAESLRQTPSDVRLVNDLLKTTFNLTGSDQARGINQIADSSWSIDSADHLGIGS